MELQYLRRKRCFLTKAIWKYKNASDSLKLKLNQQKRFVSDITSLYEKSNFSDLVLECSRGIVYSHKVIVACRSPCLWYLLSQIVKIQASCRSKYPETLTIFLPDIQFLILHNFISSLYTNNIDHLAGSVVTDCLEEYIVSLHTQRQPLQKPETRLVLEELDEEEERVVQQILIEEICKGGISKQKGNLKDLDCISKQRKVFVHHRKNRLRSQEKDRCGAAATPLTRKEQWGPPQKGRSLQTCTKNAHFLTNKSYLHSPQSSQLYCSDIQKDQSSFNSLKLKLSDSSNTSLSNLSNVHSSGSPNYMCDSNEQIHTHDQYSKGVKCFPTELETSSDNDSPTTYIPAQSRSLVNVNMNRDPHPDEEATPKVSSNVPCQQVDFKRVGEGRASSSQRERDEADTNSSNSLDNCATDEEKTQSHLARDHSLLHETSSLEVEPSSSYEEQSLTPDSTKSDPNSVEKVGKDGGGAESLALESISERETTNTSNGPINPHKPLVRTRTFEIIQIHTNDTAENSSQEAVNGKDKDTSSTINSNVPHSDSLPTAADEPSKQSCVNYKEMLSQNDVAVDPLSQSENERKQGSLIFEHNFQTFSNIPTTNMMMNSGLVNLSMSSESSMGLGSLYASMVSSVHSLSGAEQAILQKLVQPSITLPNLTNVNDLNNPTLESIHSAKFGAIGNCSIQKELLERESSRSPSPDSLCIDDIKEKGSGKPDLSKESNLTKEELVVEIKEKDDKELITNKCITSKSPDENELVATCADDISQTETIPPLSDKKDDPPKCSLEDNRPSRTQRQTSYSSVKDVDAIPLVTGYVPIDDDNEQQQEQTNAQQDAKSQSIFSMFIDFNELPTPEEKKSKEKEEMNKTKQPSGGMFMFIEADTLSPKLKKKTCTESEGGGMAGPNLSSTPKRFGLEQKLKRFDAKSKDGKFVKESVKDHDLEIQQKDATKKTNDGIEQVENGKKGFFVFIDGSDSPKESPKLKKRPILHRKPKTAATVMSKSAPSDSLLFKSEESSSKIPLQEPSNKFMTKSVIDRDEFMSQPPARRNVSLNDKINESSKIPRPVSNFKERLSMHKDGKSPEGQKLKEFKPLLSKPKKISSDEYSGNNNRSLEASNSDIDHSSLNVSFSEAHTNISGDFSETSDVSSLLSSLERSNDPELDGKVCQASLGDDLLKMFLNEVNTDVTIQIGERKIKAHKCILASRCIYFAAMLSGHYVEHAGNIIKLQGFSYDSVMVALKHIYCGTSSIPGGSKIGELAALSDMLALDGLKDVVSLYLKSKLCHYFHKPCADCLNGILDVMPLSAAYGLDELYHKCLKWAAKYFVLVFPTRNFASLPPELQDRCLKQLMDDMSVSNIIDTAVGCEKVLSLLPVVRWAQNLLDLTTQLLESCSNFIAANMSAVFASDKFLSLGRESGWSIDSLEELLKVSCDLIKPDQAVLSHIQLTNLIETRTEENSPYNEAYFEMLERLLNQIEKFIIHNANRVAVCRKWPLLPPETQKRIKDSASVVTEFSKPTHSKSKSASCRVRPRGTSIEPVPRARACSMSDQRLSRSASATAVPPKSNTVKKLLPVNGRCHTPPPSTMRTSLQTPPPTRASTLRAQARQAAIHRSQSTKTVCERPKSARSGKMDTSREDISSYSNQNTSSSSQFPRGSTFTRSLSRPDQSCRRSLTPIQHGSNLIQPASSSLHVTTATGSSPNTPGIADRVGHKRNASGPPLTTMRGSTSEDDGSRKGSFSFKARPLSNTSRSPLSSKVPRVHLLDFPSTSGEDHDIQKPHHKTSEGILRTSSQTFNAYTARPSNKESYPRMSSTLQTKLPASTVIHNGVMDFHSEVRSRASSVSNKRDTAANICSILHPGLGSRSNTFSKDDVDNK